MAPLTFVDISGVGNTGKSAVVDLLREFRSVYVPEYWFEFDFIRAPNGLLDLRHRLVEDWSPVKAHYGVMAFRRTAQMMGVDPQWWDIAGLMQSTSQRYDARFNGRFIALAEEFSRSLVVVRYLAEWPHDTVFDSGARRFALKLSKRLGLRWQMRSEVLVPDGRDFDARATAFLNDLYRSLVPPETSVAVMNNGFEPYDPCPALDMIEGSRQIVVVRDPRDVYVSGQTAHSVDDVDRHLLPFDNDGMNKSFLATDDLKAFVERTRVQYQNLFRGDDPRVLRVRFEDFCLDHDAWKRKIMGFLRLDECAHIAPGRHFKPEQSARNVGLWRRYSRRQEVDFIARELPDLLYNPQ